MECKKFEFKTQPGGNGIILKEACADFHFFFIESLVDCISRSANFQLNHEGRVKRRMRVGCVIQHTPSPLKCFTCIRSLSRSRI